MASIGLWKIGSPSFIILQLVPDRCTCIRRNLKVFRNVCETDNLHNTSVIDHLRKLISWQLLGFEKWFTIIFLFVIGSRHLYLDILQFWYWYCVFENRITMKNDNYKVRNNKISNIDNKKFHSWAQGWEQKTQMFLSWVFSLNI